MLRIALLPAPNVSYSRNDKRAFLGAVAGIVMTNEIRNYALNQGFYLIEPSGEKFNIIPPNCNQKEW
jgi:hypothetical protein